MVKNKVWKSAFINWVWL